MTYTTNGPTQLVEIAPHVFLGCRISRIEGLSPERQLMQTYMMDNHEGKDIEYRGLISFSAEDADSVADASGTSRAWSKDLSGRNGNAGNRRKQWRLPSER